MRTARFIPRSFTREPAAFGRAATLDWFTSAERQFRVELAAAQLQHTFALQFRRAAQERGTPLKSYAAENQITYARLCRVLRGEVVVKVEDLATAGYYFGLHLYFGPWPPSMPRSAATA